MNIDWSKAPEGATHGRFLREEGGVALADFYRMDGPKFECFSPDRRIWVQAFWGPEQCEHRPEPEPEFSILEFETRQAIIETAAKHCGLSGDAIRQLATHLAAEGYRKFEIVDEEQ